MKSGICSVARNAEGNIAVLLRSGAIIMMDRTCKEITRWDDDQLVGNQYDKILFSVLEPHEHLYVAFDYGLFKYKEGKRVWTFSQPEFPFWDFNEINAETLMVATTRDYLLTIDQATGHQKQLIIVPYDSFFQWGRLSRGLLLAFNGFDLVIWNSDTLAKANDVNINKTWKMSCSPCGQLVAIKAYSEIVMYEFPSWSVKWRTPLEVDANHVLEFSPDGRYLAYIGCCQLYTCRLFSTHSGHMLSVFSRPVAMRNGEGLNYFTFTFSLCGTRFFIGDKNRTIHRSTWFPDLEMQLSSLFLQTSSSAEVGKFLLAKMIFM